MEQGEGETEKEREREEREGGRERKKEGRRENGVSICLVLFVTCSVLQQHCDTTVTPLNLVLNGTELN